MAAGQESSPLFARSLLESVAVLLVGTQQTGCFDMASARLRRFGQEHGIPVAYCDDFGHGARHTLLRVGHRVQLDAGEGTLRYL